MAVIAHVQRGKMDDERARQDGGASTDPTPRKRRKWPWILFLVVIVLPAAVFAAWTAIALNWSYSEGRRAGYIQKFSKKGWVCKTWEGEIAMTNIPGTAPEKFAFSVRDEDVANKMNTLMGDQVSITYQQHPGIPGTCFGETDYFVTAVTPVKPAK
jgi:hypothetical protein